MRTPLALILGLAVLAGGSRAVLAAESDRCAAVGDLRFVCGLHQPEDLVRVPATRWLIASSMEGKGTGGLFLIDTRAKSTHKLNFGEQITSHPDTTSYSTCTQPPEASDFAAHGLNLRMRSRRQGTLYVVGHGARESIEVFDLDARASSPTLTWRGCVLMPANNPANSVASLPDGTIYATVIMRPGMTFQQMLAGEKTGDVYMWKPGQAQFELLPTLSFAGNNGIEVSADGSTLYVNASGSQDLFAFSRAAPTELRRSAHFANFLPDNMHWTEDGQLIVAGMSDDDPACGRPGADGGPVDMATLTSCNRGSVVVLVDPKTMAVKVLYAGKANPAFTGATTGVVIGDSLWLGSFTGDRVAYRSLKPAD